MNIEELLETIKDTSRDYVGMNGCLYQDITRDELDLIVNEIERLNNIINEYDEKTQMLDSVCRSLEFSAPENDYIFKERLREIIDELKELKENK